MSPHEPLTHLAQDQLIWISRYADRLRVMEPEFARAWRGYVAEELARSAWEDAATRVLAPEDAADRWLAHERGRA
jgi:hypothetical protein